METNRKGGREASDIKIVLYHGNAGSEWIIEKDFTLSEAKILVRKLIEKNKTEDIYYETDKEMITIVKGKLNAITITEN